MPSRRRFLLSAALASGLAGCTGDSTDGTTERTTATETATTHTAGPASRTTRTSTDGTPTTADPTRETPESEAVRWRVDFGDAVAHAPTVTEGRVFVPVGKPRYGSDEPSVGALAGLDAGDGTPRWTARLPAAPTGRPRTDGTGVYCTTGASDGLGLHGRNQRCLAFDRGGTERWRTDPVDQFLHVLALGDGRAYLGTSDDALDVTGQRLFAVGFSDGRTQWSAGTGDAREGRFLEGSVLVAPGGRAVARHDARTGERTWQRKGRVLSSGTTSFATADGALFVTGSPDAEDAVTAVELADGSRRWSYAPDDADTFSPTGAAVGSDVVVGVAYDGLVFVLDPSDGTEHWTFDADGKTRQPPIIADGTVYLRGYRETQDDVIQALDAATGTEQWRATVPGFATWLRPIRGAVAVAGGETGGSIRALDAADGAERWSFSTREKVTAPVVANGRVYVASENGVVRALGGGE